MFTCKGQLLMIGHPVVQHISYLLSVCIVRGDRDSRANLMPIYGDLYQIKL